MYGIENIGLFIVSGLILNILPGPDSLLIAGRSLSQGFKGGSAAALGIGAGTFVHIFAAMAGLSVVIATSATAFTVIKILGGLYLIYIAVSMILDRESAIQIDCPKQRKEPYRKIFIEGFLTNILNPKVAVFFLAFIPQFISPESQSHPMAFLILGVIFNVNGMLWCHFLAWTSAAVGERVVASGKVKKWLNRIAATMFGYFGIKLVLTAQS